MMREVRVAHVELSLSGAIVPQARTPAEADLVPNLERWAGTVLAAAEPCLVIDARTTILAMSVSCGELLGLGKPAEAVGQPLLEGGALRLIDFTASGDELPRPEVEKIPPLLALRSRRLARGLMRVPASADEGPLTIDAVATPLVEGEQVVASLTFFSAVRY
jgi:hypothetical protein